MTWKNITVEQFQAVLKLQAAKMDEMDRLTAIIATLYGVTESEVNDWHISYFSDKAKEISKLLSEPIEAKPPKYIRVNMRKYAVNYNIEQFTQRQFSEVVHFNQNMFENMHLILASIVQPVKYGFKRKNKADDHALYAADLVHASVYDVFGACVFFCKLYSSFLRATGDYLKAEEVAKLLNDSAELMDGFITQKK